MLCKFNIEQQFRSQSAVDQGYGIDEKIILNIQYSRFVSC